MPIYCFKCVDCEVKVEKLLRLNQDRIICNECGGLMFRDFSAEKPNFHLKGGCWAKQGYEMSDRHCLEENDKMCKEDDLASKDT